MVTTKEQKQTWEFWESAHIPPQHCSFNFYYFKIDAIYDGTIFPSTTEKQIF